MSKIVILFVSFLAIATIVTCKPSWIWVNDRYDDNYPLTSQKRGYDNYLLIPPEEEEEEGTWKRAHDYYPLASQKRGYDNYPLAPNKRGYDNYLLASQKRDKKCIRRFYPCKSTSECCSGLTCEQRLNDIHCR